MRVGLLSPITSPVPPRTYGSWELVVGNLAAGLVARGHEVTVFASGDSRPEGRLVAAVPRSLGVDTVGDAQSATQRHLEEALAHADELDVLHNHMDALPLPHVVAAGVPTVTTLHGSASVPASRAVYRRYAHLPYVSISDAERGLCPDLRYLATVHNGIDVDRFAYRRRGGDYLCYVGRICPEKGVHVAIEAAQRAGVRLVLAGVVHAGAADYWTDVVAPAVRAGVAEFAGPLEHDEKAALVSGALGFVHLVSYDEPFGLTMAEAMACGTPVVALRRGSVPEVVADRETGFVVDDVTSAATAIPRLADLDRAACRRRAERCFSIERMAAGYEEVYAQVAAEHQRAITRGRRAARRRPRQHPPVRPPAPGRC